MASNASEEIDALMRRVEEAEDERVEPLLTRLARLAQPGTEAWALAHRELARHAVERQPWQASVLARRVLDADPEDHLAWGLLALAQSLLGNHEYAIAAYRRALKLAPDNPWYLHNLGHLYDAVLDRPQEGVALLRRAVRRLPENSHIVASLAHALARCGRPDEARELMRSIVRRPAIFEHHALYSWLIDLSERAVELHLERHADDQQKGPLPARRARKSRRTQ
jgi:Flp pilus assembly protein TadD